MITPYSAEEKCWVWLQKVLKQRNVMQQRLVEHFGSAQAVWRTVRDYPSQVEALSFVTKKAMETMRESADPALVNAFFRHMEERDIFAVTYHSPDYPQLLKTISSPPLVLYCKGRRDMLATEKAIAVIGRRKPEQYGRDAAEMIAKGLAQSGVTVISGMAYGIDSCAHAAALDADGSSIAVLGCGPDVIYPREKEFIYNSLCRKGLIISEYPPGTEPLREHFPARNRIISGLCAGIVIVEAAVRSGTKITVDFANEQGRDVFVVPGSIFSPGSEGTNELLQEGAVPIKSAEDILDYYHWPHHTAETKPQIIFTAQEQQIIEAIGLGEAEFDTLSEELDMTIPQLSGLLSALELKGVLVCLPGRRYTIKHS